jgi:hypothetical protein
VTTRLSIALAGSASHRIPQRIVVDAACSPPTRTVAMMVTECVWCHYAQHTLSSQDLSSSDESALTRETGNSSPYTS